MSEPEETITHGLRTFLESASDIASDQYPTIHFEVDSESGEVTAYNDDLRIMTIGKNREEASARFHDVFQARADLISDE